MHCAVDNLAGVKHTVERVFSNVFLAFTMNDEELRQPLAARFDD